MTLGRLWYEPEDAVPTNGAGKLHVFYELGDHLGSTSVVLDQATGELVERTTFEGYGATESDYRPGRWKSYREDRRFTGKEEDVEVGLYYFGKRYLNPLLGRWVSADPLSVHEPGADLDVYAYVSSRVLLNTDPLGLTVDFQLGDVEARNANDRGTGALQSYGMPSKWLTSTRTATPIYNVEAHTHYTSSFWRHYEHQGLYIAARERTQLGWAAIGLSPAARCVQRGRGSDCTRGNPPVLRHAADASGKAVMRRAEAYYSGLGLYSKGGALVGVTDGKRAAQEAAAEYVRLSHDDYLGHSGKDPGCCAKVRLAGTCRPSKNTMTPGRNETRSGYDMVAGDSNEYRINKNMSPERKKRCSIQRCSRGALVTTSHIMLC